MSSCVVKSSGLRLMALSQTHSHFSAGGASGSSFFFLFPSTSATSLCFQMAVQVAGWCIDCQGSPQSGRISLSSPTPTIFFISWFSTCRVARTFGWLLCPSSENCSGVVALHVILVVTREFHLLLSLQQGSVRQRRGIWTHM